MVQGRWFVMGVGIVVMIVSAGAYSFGAYSQKLKSALDIDQESLNLIANCKDLGVNFGLLSGLLYDYWSPAGVLLVGAVETATGYSLAWMSVKKRIPPSVWSMCLYQFVGANSQSMLNISVMVYCVYLFPASKGSVIGLLKGYIGVSGAILIQVYITLWGDGDPEAFLLMLVWLPSSVTLLSILVFRRQLTPFRGIPDSKYIYMMLALGFALAFYLMGVSLAHNLVSLSTAQERGIGFGLIILLFVPLMAIVYRAEIYGKKSSEEKPHTHDTSIGYGDHTEMITPESNNQRIDSSKSTLHVTSENPKPKEIIPELSVVRELKIEESNNQRIDFSKSTLHVTSTIESQNPKPKEIIPELSTVRELKVEESDNAVVTAIGSRGQSEFLDVDLNTTRASTPEAQGRLKSWPRRGEDHTILQTLRSLDFWLLFIVTTFGVGSGLTATDNMGQLGLALGYSSSAVRTFVSLVSIWNAIGRWVGGFASDFLLRHYGISRALFLAVVMVLMAMAFLLIALAVPGCLYFGSIFLGLSFGAQYPLYATIVADVFGLKYYATLLASINLASPVGMYLLSVPVVGRFYDAEAKRESNSALVGSNGSLTCQGSMCFGLSLLVLMGVTLGAAACAAALWFRTRNLYREAHAEYQHAIGKSAKFAKSSRELIEAELAVRGGV